MGLIFEYWLWVIGLALLLYIPVSVLIYIFSVRRLEKKLKRPLELAELKGQKRRANFIATFVCLAFSILFNFRLLS